MQNLGEMVRGSIDMHVHFGPDSNFARRLDAMDTALNAQEMGLKAIVLKSHDYATAPLAHIIGRIATQIKIFGGITLDFELGGINPYVVECSAKLGAKVLWMPTLSSANSRAKIARHLGIRLKGEGISILDGKGDLLPQVKDILNIAKDHEMVVATGHVSPVETFRLVDFAQQIGLSTILASHVLADDALEESLTLTDQQHLTEKSVFIEHCLVTLMPVTGRLDPKEMVNAIKHIGAEHCIISSDLGLPYYCSPAEGMRMFMGILLRAGLSEEEIELMAKVNPAKLLGLT